MRAKLKMAQRRWVVVEIFGDAVGLRVGHGKFSLQVEYGFGKMRKNEGLRKCG
jgi:hypothetical protein